MDTPDRNVLELVADGLEQVFDARAASVTVPGSDGVLVVCRPEELEPLERLQLRAAEGPLHRAAFSGELVDVADLGAAERVWPTYVPCAVRAGIRAALAVPLTADGHPGSALALYRTASRGCTDTELAFAKILADLMSAFLSSSRVRREQQALVEQLQTALDSRVVLEQAKGMVAARHDVDVRTAFEKIRAYSRSHNQTIASVAQLIVDGDPHITRALDAGASSSRFSRG